jgi:diketogulonate reductase-like aldo/keto reductase
MSKDFPQFIYGTAWKEGATKSLVQKALNAGFRAIDTANQAKHYNEILVGEAINNVINNGEINRSDLWLQSKFTSVNGQDGRLPYDLNVSITTQVEQSFEDTLEHLHTDYLDSYLLHGPYNYPSLGDEDFEVWEVMEDLFNEGLTKNIGISNVNLQQLELLCKNSKIKPMTVQNRCFANQSWDKEIREFCKSNNIHYQGFSLLTANPQILQAPEIFQIATKYEALPAQIIFAFAKKIGILPLTGTCDVEHMKLDLEALDIELSLNEIDLIRNLQSF